MTDQVQFQEVNLELGELDRDFQTAGSVVAENIGAVDVELETEAGSEGADAGSKAGAESEGADTEPEEGEETFLAGSDMDMANGLSGIAYAPDGTLFGNDYNSKLYTVSYTHLTLPTKLEV